MALVRLHEAVVDHMRLQVALCDEGKRASREGALEWTFICLQGIK